MSFRLADVGVLRYSGAVSREIDEDESTFETADAGSSQVYPQAAAGLRKGSYVMIKRHPCKVADLSFSKTGKHGRAKTHIVANDIFTGMKCEDLCPSSHNMEIPFVSRTEFQILRADADTGEITLLTESGEINENLFLPDQVKVGEPTDDDKYAAMPVWGPACASLAPPPAATAAATATATAAAAHSRPLITCAELYQAWWCEPCYLSDIG